MHSVMGDTRGVRVMEYNADDKVYTYNAYNSLGEHQMATGHVLDNTWTWTFRSEAEWRDCERSLHDYGGFPGGLHLQVRDSYQ
jgi:hypothetical protein